jgi:hypothetical protein
MELASLKSWADENPGLLSLAALLVSVLVVTVGVIRWKVGRKRDAQRRLRERVGNAEKWRTAFLEYLEEQHAKELDRGLVIRDIGRINEYLKTKGEKGISTSFRVGLAGIYHSGIQVHLGMLEITHIKAIEDNTNWYYCDYDDPQGKKVHLIGKIPFNRIEEVNWQGDEYDSHPHVYCRFDSTTGEPYDELVYCEMIDRRDSWPYFSEIVRLQDMRNKRIC